MYRRSSDVERELSGIHSASYAEQSQASVFLELGFGPGLPVVDACHDYLT